MPSASALPHVRRASAVWAWAMLLLIASLGALGRGALHDAPFATAADIDIAVAASQRLACVVGAEQPRASGNGPGGNDNCAAITAFEPLVPDQSSSTASAADSILTFAVRCCPAAQPRAPPSR